MDSEWLHSPSLVANFAVEQINKANFVPGNNSRDTWVPKNASDRVSQFTGRMSCLSGICTTRHCSKSKNKGPVVIWEMCQLSWTYSKEIPTGGFASAAHLTFATEFFGKTVMKLKCGERRRGEFRFDQSADLVVPFSKQRISSSRNSSIGTKPALFTSLRIPNLWYALGTVLCTKPYNPVYALSLWSHCSWKVHVAIAKKTVIAGLVFKADPSDSPHGNPNHQATGRRRCHSRQKDVVFKSTRQSSQWWHFSNDTVTSIKRWRPFVTWS